MCWEGLWDALGSFGGYTHGSRPSLRSPGWLRCAPPCPSLQQAMSWVLPPITECCISSKTSFLCLYFWGGDKVRFARGAGRWAGTGWCHPAAPGHGDLQGWCSRGRARRSLPAGSMSPRCSCTAPTLHFCPRAAHGAVSPAPQNRVGCLGHADGGHQCRGHHMCRYGKATSTQSTASAWEQLCRCPASSLPSPRGAAKPSPGPELCQPWQSRRRARPPRGVDPCQASRWDLRMGTGVRRAGGHPLGHLQLFGPAPASAQVLGAADPHPGSWHGCVFLGTPCRCPPCNWTHQRGSVRTLRPLNE